MGAFGAPQSELGYIVPDSLLCLRKQQGREEGWYGKAAVLVRNQRFVRFGTKTKDNWNRIMNNIWNSHHNFSNFIRVFFVSELEFNNTEELNKAQQYQISTSRHHPVQEGSSRPASIA